MDGQGYLGDFPKPKELNPHACMGWRKYIVLFCIKTPLKDTNRFIYINVLGSSSHEDIPPGTNLPYKIPCSYVCWVQDDVSSRDCVVNVPLQLMHFYQLQKDSQYRDLMDKMVREWFTICNKNWKLVKGLDAISELEIDTTKNYTILRYQIEPTIERISAQRYTGRHEFVAAKPKNIEMNKFLNMLKSSRPDHCDWPEFTDETEMFCVQLTCTEVGNSLFLNFLGTHDKDKLNSMFSSKYGYSPLYWRKGWPDYDLIAFAWVDMYSYQHRFKNEIRVFPDHGGLRNRVVQKAIDMYITEFRRFNIRTCINGVDCDAWNEYSILKDGEFVEPSPCYAEPEDSIIHPDKEITFMRQTVDETFVVSVKLRRMPDRIKFNDDFVEIFDGIWTAVAKFYLPIHVDLTQPLKYKWKEEERNLYLEFRVHETLDP